MRNNYEIRGDITAIFLDYKGNKYEAIIETSDLEKIKQFPNKWLTRSNNNGKSIYATGLYYGNNKTKAVHMHRYIMDAPECLYVDHIDHDTLNNRRSNLRLATPGQNRQNSPFEKSFGSGYRNVSWEKDKKKWVVRIYRDRRTIFYKAVDILDEAVVIAKVARENHVPFSYEAKLKERAGGNTT